MRVGIPTENQGRRESCGHHAVWRGGVQRSRHDVIIQQGAGRGSAIPDDAYRTAGAAIVPDAAGVWQQADLVLKVKEPLEPEFAMMRAGQVLFTYLHLAASTSLTERLRDTGVVAIGYETGAAR